MKNKLNKNLILVYTGIKRTAHDIARGYVSKLQKAKRSHIIEILNFVKEGEKIKALVLDKEVVEIKNKIKKDNKEKIEVVKNSEDIDPIETKEW